VRELRLAAERSNALFCFGDEAMDDVGGGLLPRYEPDSPPGPVWQRFDIGKEGAEPVTDDYPGEARWAFVGGTIEKAVVDVSGEPFVDLAKEGAAAFARD
jgi:arylsulfatase